MHTCRCPRAPWDCRPGSTSHFPAPRDDDGYQATDYLNRDVLRTSARTHGNGRDLREPLLSPLYADSAGSLLLLLIQAGAARDAAGRQPAVCPARTPAAGVDVQLEVFEHMVHVWHFTWFVQPKARQAMRQLGRFVRRRVAFSTSPENTFDAEALRYRGSQRKVLSTGFVLLTPSYKEHKGRCPS